jgi:hypothetical protein
MRKFKVGDIVKRVRGSFNGVVEGGVYEVTGNLGRDAIGLLGQGGSYDEAMFELFQEATPTTPRGFKVGDRVRMISHDPAYGRGEVRVGDIGVVAHLQSGGDLTVDFPNQEDWDAHVDDIEHADPLPSSNIPEVSLDEAVANWQNVSQQIKELQAQASNYERVMRRNGIQPV